MKGNKDWYLESPFFFFYEYYHITKGDVVQNDRREAGFQFPNFFTLVESGNSSPPNFLNLSKKKKKKWLEYLVPLL